MYIIKGFRNTKIKGKKVFALYLSSSKMVYIAFCHETLYSRYFQMKWLPCNRNFMAPDSFWFGLNISEADTTPLQWKLCVSVPKKEPSTTEQEANFVKWIRAKLCRDSNRDDLLKTIPSAEVCLGTFVHNKFVLLHLRLNNVMLLLSSIRRFLEFALLSNAMSWYLQALYSYLVIIWSVVFCGWYWTIS